MKIVGVMGNSGAGKTTFSNLLGKREDVGVIHVDDFIADVKRKYFKMFLESKKENPIENTRNNPKLKSEVKKFFYNNKVIFGLFSSFRSLLVRKRIDTQIKQYAVEGKRLVVIDDWILPTHKQLYKRLNKVYYLDRGFVARRKGLKERENLSEDEMKIADLPYSLKFIKKIQDEKVIVVNNKGSLEVLKQRAKEEYEKLCEPTFDERYKVSTEDLIPMNSNLTKSIEKILKVREKSIDDSVK